MDIEQIVKAAERLKDYAGQLRELAGQVEQESRFLLALLSAQDEDAE